MAIITTIILTNCSNPHNNERPEWGEIPPPIWSGELFESEADGYGYTRTTFRTNDPQHWNQEGSTIWTVWGDTEAVFESRTVRMAKTSGEPVGGFGIVFCQGEHEINGRLLPAMLVVMINNVGEYIVGKAIGGVFTDFNWWQSTAHLNRGSGSSNEITVTFDEDNGQFILIINGHEIERFRDDNEPRLRSGRNGYITVITPFDNFPVTGINILFWEKK